MPNALYLFIAYGVFWLLPLLLVLSMWSRQRRIEREIDRLEQRLERPEQRGERVRSPAIEH